MIPDMKSLVGKTGTYTRTVSESDVYLFGGISGDLHFCHFDEEYMKQTAYKRRLVHGILVLGLMATAGGRLNEQNGWSTVSKGYKSVEFIKPAFIGDTLRAEYKIVEVDEEKKMFFAEMTCHNQHGEKIAVAYHSSQFIE